MKLFLVLALSLVLSTMGMVVGVADGLWVDFSVVHFSGNQTPSLTMTGTIGFSTEFVSGVTWSVEAFNRFNTLGDTTTWGFSTDLELVIDTAGSNISLGVNWTTENTWVATAAFRYYFPQFRPIVMRE